MGRRSPSWHDARTAADCGWSSTMSPSSAGCRRIRTEFIDNLSHELRTPLTTVSLLAETLSREAEGPDVVLPPKMRDRIGKIEVETGHLVQMVNELLDLSRIESGGTLALVDGLDMGSLAAQSAERLRLFADRQGVTLLVEARTACRPSGATPSASARSSSTSSTTRSSSAPMAGRSSCGCAMRAATSSRPSRITASGSRATLRTASSSGSTRSIERACGPRRAAAPASASRSPGTSWNSMAGASGSNSAEGAGSTFSFALPVAGNGKH